MPVTNESVSLPSGPVPIDVYRPPSSGKHAGVLILHGTLEMEPPFGAAIVEFAEALNKKGIAAAIPRYFKSTKTKAGDEAMRDIFVHLPAWKTACGRALAFMAADARFDATRLGVLGFSLGGHIALSLGMERLPGASVKAVVEFFAPTLAPALPHKWAALPTVLIHHGTDDPLTIENSRLAVRELKAVGRTVVPSIFGKPAPAAAVTDDQFIEYPGEKHGFQGAALAGSRDTTVEFLDRRLK